MTVYELTRAQLNELKNAYFWDENPRPCFDHLGRPALCPEDIADELIFGTYADIDFVDDDFLCKEEENNREVFCH